MPRSTVHSRTPTLGVARRRRSTSSGIELAVKIVLRDEAQRRFEAEDEWWRAHRDAKELFIDELEQTLSQAYVAS